MDRSTVLRVLLLALPLVAGVAVLLGRDWAPAPEPIPSRAIADAQQQTDLRVNAIESSVVESAPSVRVAPPTAVAIPINAFHGTVVDAVTQQPVTAFEVQLIRRNESNGVSEDKTITRTFQSPIGQFSWNGLAYGTWRAAVSASGYQLFNVDEFKLTADGAKPAVVMPLRRGFAVSGRVLDRNSRTSIADATIVFRHKDVAENPRKSQAHAKSKADGSFTLDGIPGGDIVLVAYARDRAPNEVALLVDGTNPPVEITLSAGGRISGTVTTREGVPVAGQILLSGGNPGYFSKTNDAGQFAFDHMRPGRYAVSAITTAGSARHELVLREDEINDSIALIVGAGRSVRGTVRGLRFQEQPQTSVMLRTNAGLSFSAHPDEHGAFLFKGVPPGPAVVMLFDSVLQIEKTVDVPSDRDVTLDFVLPTGARLSGRVSQGGQAAANMNVWMRPSASQSDIRYQAQTSAEGRYEIDGLPPGEYRLQVVGDIGRTLTMAGDAILNIDLPAAQISARIVEDGSVPIVGATVFLRGSAPETARVRSDKQTNDFGELSLTGVEPGEVVLIVYKPGYEMHRETIAYSTPLANRTITLRKSAGVEIKVPATSNRFPRGFTITQVFPGTENVVDLWIPLDDEHVGRVPNALIGTAFQIGRFSGKPIVIEDWDGTPFDLP